MATKKFKILFALFVMSFVITGCAAKNEDAAISGGKINDEAKAVQPENVKEAPLATKTEVKKDVATEKKAQGGNMTEIVFQEETNINNLSEFVKASQNKAVSIIGKEAELKYIKFSYKDGAFSYNAFYINQRQKLAGGMMGNLEVSYNKSWSLINNPHFSGWAQHDPSHSVNKELIGVQCNLSEYCARFYLPFYTEKTTMNFEDIKISLMDLVKKYGANDFFNGLSGDIFVDNGLLEGSWAKYKFDPRTGDSVDPAKDNLFEWRQERLKANS